MKNVRRIAALFLVAGATLIGSMVASPGGASAAGATINCAIPNNVVCQVSHPDGIKSVKVTVDFGGGIGNIDVVDNTYAACPKNVQVSWDPIVPNASFDVETCKGLKLTNGNPVRPGGMDGIQYLVAVTQMAQPQGLTSQTRR